MPREQRCVRQRLRRLGPDGQIGQAAGGAGAGGPGAGHAVGQDAGLEDVGVGLAVVVLHPVELLAIQQPKHHILGLRAVELG